MSPDLRRRKFLWNNWRWMQRLRSSHFGSLLWIIWLEPVFKRVSYLVLTSKSILSSLTFVFLWSSDLTFWLRNPSRRRVFCLFMEGLVGARHKTTWFDWHHSACIILFNLPVIFQIVTIDFRISSTNQLASRQILFVDLDVWQSFQPERAAFMYAWIGEVNWLDKYGSGSWYIYKITYQST